MGRCHQGAPRQRSSGRDEEEIQALTSLQRRALVVVLPLVLAACAALPGGDTALRIPPSPAEFEFDGRISVRQGDSRSHGNINWRHTAARDEVLITTPLGQGVAELSRDAAGARLLMADGKEYAAADWEDLAERTFGTRLPLNDLPQWLTGHAPAAATGWRVDYLDYQSEAVDALPTLVEAKRGDIELRLKIDVWSGVR